MKNIDTPLFLITIAAALSLIGCVSSFYFSSQYSNIITLEDKTIVINKINTTENISLMREIAANSYDHLNHSIKAQSETYKDVAYFLLSMASLLLISLYILINEKLLTKRSSGTNNP